MDKQTAKHTGSNYFPTPRLCGDVRVDDRPPEEISHMQTDEQVAPSTGGSSQCSQCCCRPISSSLPCPLTGAGGEGGSPDEAAALTPAAR